MGRRGPPPKGEYGGKIGRTAVLSTRLQPDTRARLVAAKTASGRSLSQELEHRLRRTFIEEDKAVEFYGTEQNAAVVRLIGATIQSAAVRISTKGKHEWLKEQWLFELAVAAQLCSRARGSLANMSLHLFFLLARSGTAIRTGGSFLSQTS
jgi:hypothetical protein